MSVPPASENVSGDPPRRRRGSARHTEPDDSSWADLVGVNGAWSTDAPVDGADEGAVPAAGAGEPPRPPRPPRPILSPQSEAALESSPFWGVAPAVGSSGSEVRAADLPAPPVADQNSTTATPAAPAPAPATGSRRDRAKRRSSSPDAGDQPPGSPSSVDPTRPWWAPSLGSSAPADTPAPAAGSAAAGSSSTEPGRTEPAAAPPPSRPLLRRRSSSNATGKSAPLGSALPGGPAAGPVWQQPGTGPREDMFSRPGRSRNMIEPGKIWAAQ